MLSVLQKYTHFCWSCWSNLSLMATRICRFFRGRPEWDTRLWPCRETGYFWVFFICGTRFFKGGKKKKSGAVFFGSVDWQCDSDSVTCDSVTVTVTVGQCALFAGDCIPHRPGTVKWCIHCPSECSEVAAALGTRTLMHIPPHPTRHCCHFYDPFCYPDFCGVLFQSPWTSVSEGIEWMAAPVFEPSYKKSLLKLL